MIDAEKRRFVSHVKSLFQPDLLHKLSEQVEYLSRTQIQGDITEREQHAAMRGESVDRLRMRSMWYDVWKYPASRDVLLETIAPFNYVIFPVQVRYVRNSNQHYVPWHQDIAYIRLLGKRAHQQVITCFIPLEAEPAKCTTIQFAQDTPEYDELHLHAHDPADGFGAGIKDADFKQTIHYDLNLGDALLFGDHTVHRTYLPEHCDVNRRSLEFRLVRHEHLIADKDYFDIENSIFVRSDENRKLIPSQIGNEEAA